MNYTAEIRSAAGKQILVLAAQSADGKETGGILLGRGPDENGLIIVEQAGAPGPQADRRSDFFLRDLAYAKEFAGEAWETNKAIWVGEWHTHPRGPVQPSPRDLTTYAGLISDPALKFRAFVSIIVVPDPDWRSPRMLPWVLAPSAPVNSREEPGHGC